MTYCEQSAEHQAFEAAARALDDVEFFQTTAADAGKVGGLSAPGIAVVRVFEDATEKAAFSGSATDKDAIRDFVKAERVR